MRKKILLILLALVAALGCFTACADAGGGSTTPPEGSTALEEAEADPTFFLGMYGISNENDAAGPFEEVIKNGRYNVFNLNLMNENELDKWAQMIYDAGKKFWMYGAFNIWSWGSSYPYWLLREDCYVALNEFAETYREKPWWDAFLGFHLDEPLLSGMTLEDLYEGSKAYHDVFPEKRLWVNFAAYAFNDSLTGNGERMEKWAGEYITDLSFDLYGDMNALMDETFDNMVNMFEGEGKYFWAVPRCMSYAGTTDEAGSLEHVNEFFEKIKNTEGGVGMCLYTGVTASWAVEQIGNIGFYDLLDTQEEFMSWKDRPRPWSDYYNRMYDSSGNPINGGYKPWTTLDARLDEIAEEIVAMNEETAYKIDTKITYEENIVLEYDGLEKIPEVEPSYLTYEYLFREADGTGWSETAPTQPGDYVARVMLPETKTRSAQAAEVPYKVVESDTTQIASSQIVESYTATKSTVTVNREGLTYSFDGVEYQPYVSGTEIDVTGLVDDSAIKKCVYFKEGDKEPYKLEIRKLKSYTVFDFENTVTLTYSTFRRVANKKYSGTQSGLLADGKMVSETQYAYYLYSSEATMRPASGTNTLDYTGASGVEMWVFAEEDVTLTCGLSDQQWNNITLGSVQVTAGSWQKVTFSTANCVVPEGFDWSIIVMMGLDVSSTARVYVDDISYLKV